MVPPGPGVWPRGGPDRPEAGLSQTVAEAGLSQAFPEFPHSSLLFSIVFVLSCSAAISSFFFSAQAARGLSPPAEAHGRSYSGPVLPRRWMCTAGRSYTLSGCMTHMAMRGWAISHLRYTPAPITADIRSCSRTSWVRALSYSWYDTVPSSASLSLNLKPGFWTRRSSFFAAILISVSWMIAKSATATTEKATCSASELNSFFQSILLEK
mmetsp:Transcript_31156/g.73981  ORF Transcript_31156/g.73981 Transcript_31156/m.73981 type:complete len:210 (-) Transcript_31156:204-833(-)